MKSLLQLRLLILFGVLVFFSSCNKMEKADSGDINLRFKLKYGDQPLEMFKNYSYPITGDQFYFSRLSFYISNINIKSKDGDFLIKDIDYLNFTASHTGTVPSNGLEYKITGILPREYSALEFGIGVPQQQNGLEPKDFKSGHVLSSSAEYWAPWKSYIFFRPEGRIGLDGSQTLDLDFALHLGSDEVYTPIVLNKSFTVSGGNVTNIDITIDMQKFFNGKTLYDIKAAPMLHSLTHKPKMIELAENLSTAVN